MKGVRRDLEASGGCERKDVGKIAGRKETLREEIVMGKWSRGLGETDQGL